MAKRSDEQLQRWGGKGKKWRMKLLDDQDLAGITRYALSAARYHWDGMRYFTEQMKDSGTLDENKEYTKEWHTYFNKFYHNLRAFFWELTASFDTLLQEINRRFSLGIDESDVRWDTVSKALSGQRKYKRFLSRLSEGYGSPWFTEVREYRNFAHRGTVAVEAMAIDSEFHPEAGVQFGGMMLRPLARGRGAGEPIALCKEYGTRVRELILWALEELDSLAPTDKSDEPSATG